MRKILKSHGAEGKHGRDYNWCAEEVVGIHGMTCSNSCSCGCGRAFIGIDSAKGTTQAIVATVTAKEFGAIKERLHAERLKNWSGDQDIADESVAMLESLSRTLANVPDGSLARINGERLSFTMAKAR